MKSYRVTWEIDIDAKSPREAARKALEIQQDRESTATVFDVVNIGGRVVRPPIRIDLGIAEKGR